MNEYVQAPQQDVVLSSRVRLARNYADIPFSGKLTKDDAQEVIRRTVQSVSQSEQGASFSFLRMADLSEDKRLEMIEHNIISYDMHKYAANGAALISSGQTITVMMNEEDHLRIQGYLPGLQVDRAAELAFGMDELFCAKRDIAFDSRWGFLTSNPTNVGTGMRASVIMHLPALASAGQMSAVVQAVAKLGLTIRGFYGEGSEARGNLYQLSNQVTIGRSEEDIFHSIAAAAEQVLEHERSLREKAEKTDMFKLQDTLLRSYGELCCARLMGSREFMRRYSDVRYAASMGYLHAPIPGLDALMMDMQSGSLAVGAGKILGEREREILRARLLRERLPKLVAD